MNRPSEPIDKQIKMAGLNQRTWNPEVRLPGGAIRIVDRIAEGPDGNHYVVEIHTAGSPTIFSNSVLPRALMLFRALERKEDYHPDRFLLVVEMEGGCTDEDLERMKFAMKNYGGDSDDLLIVDQEEIVYNSIKEQIASGEARRPSPNPDGLIYTDLMLYLDEVIWRQSPKGRTVTDRDYDRIRNPHKLHQIADVSNGFAYKWARNREENGYLNNLSPAEFEFFDPGDLLEAWSAQYQLQDNERLGAYTINAENESPVEAVASWLTSADDPQRESFILTGRAAQVLGSESQVAGVDAVDLYCLDEDQLPGETGPFHEASNAEEADVYIWKPEFNQAVSKAALRTDEGVKVTDELMHKLDSRQE